MTIQLLADNDQLVFVNDLFDALNETAVGDAQPEITICDIAQDGTNNSFATVSSYTPGSPTTVTTTAAHNLSTSDKIVMTAVKGDQDLNDLLTVTVTGATTFTVPIDTTGLTLSGGEIYKAITNATELALTLITGTTSSYQTTIPGSADILANTTYFYYIRDIGSYKFQYTVRGRTVASDRNN